MFPNDTNSQFSPRIVCAAGGGGGRVPWRRCNFPRPRRVFREGRTRPLPLARGRREIARRAAPLSPTWSSRHHDAYRSRANRQTRARSRNARPLSSRRCQATRAGAGGEMLPALALLLLLALPPAQVAARRHAPDLREDEPARRTTRPAGGCNAFGGGRSCSRKARPHRPRNIDTTIVPVVIAPIPV
ncbi:unnamed protein product, partial [Iphiclides podalirius]